MQIFMYDIYLMASPLTSEALLQVLPMATGKCRAVILVQHIFPLLLAGIDMKHDLLIRHLGRGFGRGVGDDGAFLDEEGQMIKRRFHQYVSTVWM